MHVEYNRNKGSSKKAINVNGVVSNITFNLIVHSRGEYVEQDNLIAIEMKKATRLQAEKDKDRDRLIALTQSENSVWSYDGKHFQNMFADIF